jgi:hypothetical protein
MHDVAIADILLIQIQKVGMSGTCSTECTRHREYKGCLKNCDYLEGSCLDGTIW